MTSAHQQAARSSPAPAPVPLPDGAHKQASSSGTAGTNRSRPGNQRPIDLSEESAAASLCESARTATVTLFLPQTTAPAVSSSSNSGRCRKAARPARVQPEFRRRAGVASAFLLWKNDPDAQVRNKSFQPPILHRATHSRAVVDGSPCACIHASPRRHPPFELQRCCRTAPGPPSRTL